MPGSAIPDLTWVEVRKATTHHLQRVVDGPPTIDSGEAEAIALALGERTSVVIDDLKGRERARRLGVNVTGILGELMALHTFGFAAMYSHRSPEEDIDLLGQAGMRLTDELRIRVLRELRRNE
jgi:predicted nucleic acid-binding protein